jgi:RNA polymerase sigma-70 factor (ECF subfamily)
MEYEAEADALAVERFRTYLLLLARIHMDREACNRLDSSDLVQQTLLDAHRQRSSSVAAVWPRWQLGCGACWPARRSTTNMA